MTVVWPAVIGGFIAFQIACAVFGSYIAVEKNRSSTVWFFLCLGFGLVALIAVAGVPAAEPVERRWPASDGPRAWNPLQGPPPVEGE